MFYLANYQIWRGRSYSLGLRQRSIDSDSTSLVPLRSQFVFTKFTAGGFIIGIRKQQAENVRMFKECREWEGV